MSPSRCVCVCVSIITRNNITSNTTIHEEFINDKARRQFFRPYQPSSGHKYKNAEGYLQIILRYQVGLIRWVSIPLCICNNKIFAMLDG
jgi:hypothetical protein